uniref:uncharacterized protein LOC117166294 n=1 Tax=Bombus vancouverensis nearcticus TaxID=2705178 RepID=UPI00143A48D3|nr:uncharacterized protein LOC117166294 [Bombus vancouverensis nearcticus]
MSNVIIRTTPFNALPTLSLVFRQTSSKKSAFVIKLPDSRDPPEESVTEWVVSGAPLRKDACSSIPTGYYSRELNAIHNAGIARLEAIPTAALCIRSYTQIKHLSNETRYVDGNL